MTNMTAKTGDIVKRRSGNLGSIPAVRPDVCQDGRRTSPFMASEPGESVYLHMQGAWRRLPVLDPDGSRWGSRTCCGH